MYKTFVSYKVLILQPKNSSVSNPENILWKGQVIPPDNYSSVNLVMLQDNIQLNNRRTAKSWENLFTENGFKYEVSYDDETTKEFLIYDTSLIAYPFQIFACDISASNLKVEVSEIMILPILSVLNLKKEGQVNPVKVYNRIQDCREFYQHTYDAKVKKQLDTIFKILEKLCDECISYECDIEYYIEER